MIPAIVSRQQLCGMAGITHRRIEVNHTIELTLATNPVVDFLTHLFLFGRVKVLEERLTEECMLEGRDCGADDPDSLLMSARYEPAIAGDDVLRRHNFCCRNERAREKNVIPTDAHDHVLHAGLSEHVPFKAH